MLTISCFSYLFSSSYKRYFKYLYGYEQRKFRFSTTADYYAAIQPSSENPENVALQQMTMRLAQSMSGFPPYMQPGSANSHPLQNMPQMHPSVISYASDAQQNFGIWQLDNIRPGADMRIPAINPSFAPTTATSSSSSDAWYTYSFILTHQLFSFDAYLIVIILLAKDLSVVSATGMAVIFVKIQSRKHQRNFNKAQIMANNLHFRHRQHREVEPTTIPALILDRLVVVGE